MGLFRSKTRDRANRRQKIQESVEAVRKVVARGLLDLDVEVEKAFTTERIQRQPGEPLLDMIARSVDANGNQLRACLDNLASGAEEPAAYNWLGWKKDTFYTSAGALFLLLEQERQGARARL